MSKFESQKLPGGPLSEHNFYESRVNQQTLEEVGVKDPEGKFYPFLEGEKISFDRETGSDRKAFIIKSDGTRVSFTDWVKELAKAETAKLRWDYDVEHRVLIGPDGKNYQLHNLSEENLRLIAFDIRRDTSHPARWPSDIAEEITRRFLEMHNKRRKT